MHRFALLAIVAGCTSTESARVLTAEIHAMIEASTKGDGKTDVSATLFVGQPINLNYVQLTGDDQLLAKTSSQTKQLVESEILNSISHRATVDGDAEGAQIEVVFDRAVDDGAPSSIATLPAKFSLGAAPATASRGAPLTLTWSPAGTTDQMSWEAKGSCIEDEAQPITGDTGTVTIEAGALTKRAGAMTPDNCDVTWTIKRKRAGTLDSHYKAGTVFGVQYRSATVPSTP